MNAQEGSMPRYVEWVLLAFFTLAPVTALLDSPFPIFTVIWLTAPLIAVVCSRNACSVGWHLVPP